MNYLKHYCNLIRKAENRTLPEGYTEKHHIFPKSVFGNNNKIVVLTGREHYIAHALLEKAFIKRYGLKDKKTKKMIIAFWCMNNQKTKNEYLNSYLYETCRIRYVDSQKGRKLTEEHKEKIKISTSGKNNPMYGKFGKNHPAYGTTHSKEFKEKISKLLKNRVFSQETIEKIKQAKKGKNTGENNAKSNWWKLTFKNGNVLIMCGIHTWSKENGYCRQSIGKIYAGKIKTHKDIVAVEKLSQDMLEENVKCYDTGSSKPV
jgi:hypothetical protein